MTNRATLTGSQKTRELEILNRWLVFEPISDHRYALSSTLYTVPLGQDFAPNFVINSGSYELTGSAIKVEKDIHLFEREIEATNFITEVGMDNISLIKERVVDGNTWIEVHLINSPILEFDMEIENLAERGGYKMKVLRSSSFGYENVPREVKKDKRGNIISDTYLKYFDIEVDK